ncbi:hypothetical protein I5480_12920 [Citrobacter sp. FDAARGOS_156]|uniref:hypothetical protein n=1 Tax=Citrobacter sp. FDAARGOS_156 TaxID=1702170 RepID=UPI00190115EB|nr:hypothetical protein [Citrobacter sp. FDAARGOS_156]MBJ9203960.1 hypothetical protein [Citrobacter sp. FDAARGOS_156]
MKPTYEELEILLANAESNCRELAAENASLKKAAEFATAPDMWEDLGGNVLRYGCAEWYADRLKAALQTPATDTFLAEVRAQARNEFINELESRFNEMTETLPPELRSGAAGAAAFVSTFRKGAAL